MCYKIIVSQGNFKEKRSNYEISTVAADGVAPLDSWVAVH